MLRSFYLLAALRGQFSDLGLDLVQALTKLLIFEPGHVGIIPGLFGLQLHNEGRHFVQLTIGVAPSIRLLVVGHCQLSPIAVAGVVAVVQVQQPLRARPFAFLGPELCFEHLEDEGGVVDRLVGLPCLGVVAQE